MIGKIKGQTCLAILTVFALLSPMVAVAALSVVQHNSSANLTDGLNYLQAGDEFVLPPASQGGHYRIVNASGQDVAIVPGADTLRLGTLPAGHQGLLQAGAQLEVIQVALDRYHIWQGAVADGGDYYLVIDTDPQIAVSPALADFGAVELGGNQDVTFTISNLGTADLILDNIALQNPLALPFELIVSADGCSGTTVAPGGACQFTARFSPDLAEAYQDSFDIPSNDPNTPMILVNAVGSGTIVSMQVIGTDFSNAPLGAGVPQGWTERWASGPATYSVVDSADFPGEHDLKVNIHDNGQEKRLLLSHDQSDSLGADVELLMLFSDPVNEGSEHTDIRLFARASGSEGQENGYFFTTKNNQRLVRIYKYVNGQLSVLAGRNDEAISFSTKEPWWVRFRVEGSSLKARIWPYGTTEPKDWQLSAVDHDLSAAGWQGIGSFWKGDHIFHQFVAASAADRAVPIGGFGFQPLTLQAVNLDAETGDASGWINEFGQLQVTGTYHRSGNYAFQGGTADYRAYQRFDLAQHGLTPAILQQGAKVWFRAWQRCYAWNNDPGRIGLRFLDADLNEISAVYTGWDILNNTYTPKALAERIPQNAAYADIILEGQYLAGGGAGAYFDDLEAGIGLLD